MTPPDQKDSFEFTVYIFSRKITFPEGREMSLSGEKWFCIGLLSICWFSSRVYMRKISPFAKAGSLSQTALNGFRTARYI